MRPCAVTHPESRRPCRIGIGSFVLGSYKARRVAHAEDNGRRHGYHGWRHAITRSLPMTPTITAFERSPDRGKGLARDMRVRWALEEVGQPYQVRLVSFGAMKEPAHRALHPFGQIPTSVMRSRRAAGRQVRRVRSRRSSLATTRRSWFAWMGSGLSSRCRFAITCRLPSEADG
jgi:hypothetical protein